MAKKKPDTNGASTQGAKQQDSYFLSLSLENARCFRDRQTLDLSDSQGRPARWTVLLGNNGTGKTTILQALALLRLLTEAGAQREVEAIRVLQRRHLNSLLRQPGDAAGTFTVGIAAGGRLTDLSAVPGRRESSITFRIGSHQTVLSGAYPLIYAYGASRHLGTSALVEGEPDSGLETLFSDRAELLNAEEWLLRLDYSASKRSEIQEQQKRRLDHVKQLLTRRLLPEVEDIRFTEPSNLYPTPRVEFKTPYGWVGLRQLGYGYQTLIGWMVDLASRMFARYPESADPLAEPAVVLVDEIDLHLHPVWQRTLINYLTERFPNTQFIATAHSPLIVQAATGANLAVLRREGDHVIIDNDVDTIRGWRVDQILTSDLFGLKSARPPELEGLLERRKAILTKPKLTEADRRELAELEEKIGDLPTGETAEDVEIRSLLRESLELLRQKKA